MKKILALSAVAASALSCSLSFGDVGDEKEASLYNPVISNYNRKYDNYPMSRKEEPQQIAQITTPPQQSRYDQLDSEYKDNVNKMSDSRDFGDYFKHALLANQARYKMALESGKTPVMVNRRPQNCTVNTNYSDGYSSFSNVNCY